MTNNSDKTNKVDEMGIRLAPAPMKRDGQNTLPSVKQDFILRPVLDIEEPQGENGTASKPELSTADDFQPKTIDLDKRWKRQKRSKNIVCGLIMFVFSALIILPYILAAVKVDLAFMPFKYIPAQYDVVGNYIAGFGRLAAISWSGAEATAIWKSMLPDFILTFGLLFVLVNLVKSVLGICGAVKVKRYLLGSVLYLLSIVALFIAALVGAENYGITKINFMTDVVTGWQTSEFVGLAIAALAGIIASAACSFINPERSGYTK